SRNPGSTAAWRRILAYNAVDCSLGARSLMPFEITTTRHFSAAPQLRLYDGSLEELHGHNWTVKVTVAAEKLDAIGVVMDFHQLENLVDEIIVPLHNRHLNDARLLAGLNPSAENVALAVARVLKLPTGAHLDSVEVWETPQSSAIYRP